MDSKILENTVEQKTVTPNQTAKVLENKAVINNPTQAILEPKIANEEINSQFSKLPEWNAYLNDPNRRSKSEWGKFVTIEDLMSDPETYSLTNRYGMELTHRSEIMYDYFVRSGNIYGRTKDAYNNARYGLRLSAAREELSEARQEGDEEKIIAAEKKYQEEQENLRTAGIPFEKYGNTLMDLSASIFRNPETIAISVGTGLLTGGLGTVATLAGQVGAGVANAAIVYNDTFKLEAGGVLEELDRTNPEMSEAEKYGYAQQAGRLNAAIEAIPMLAGAGVLGRANTVLKKSVLRVVKDSKLPEKIIKRESFLKEFKSQLEKLTVTKKDYLKLIGEMELDAGIEAGTEVVQNIISASVSKAIEEDTKSIASIAFDDIMKFATDPFSPDQSENLNTFIDVFLASQILSGGNTALEARALTKKAGSINTLLNKVSANITTLQKLRESGQNEKVQASGKVVRDKQTNSMIKNDWFDGKIYLDKEGVLDLIKSDPEIATALSEMGVIKALEESKSNGGLIGIDFKEYDEKVNLTKSDKLYQALKGITSLSPTNLTMSEFIRYAEEKAGKTLLEESIKDPNSVYSQIKAKLGEQQGVSQQYIERSAKLGQILFNQIARFKKENQTSAEEIYKSLGIDIKVNQPSTEETTETTEPTTETKTEPSETAENITSGTETKQDPVKEIIVDNINKLEANQKPKNTLSKMTDKVIKRLNQFIGSKKEDLANQIADVLGKRKELDEARAMYQEYVNKGKLPDVEFIWNKTGWYFNEDFSWSYEIADNEASLNLPVIFNRTGTIFTGVHTTLGNMIKHDKLFDLFPDLKDIPTHIGKSDISGRQNSGHSAAIFVPSTREIILNASYIAKMKRNHTMEYVNKEIISTILHELQHYIQHKYDMMYATYSGKQLVRKKLTQEQKDNIEQLNTLYSKLFHYDFMKQFSSNVYGNKDLFNIRNKVLAAATTDEERQTVKDFVDKYIETGDYNINYNEDYYRQAQEMQARNTENRIELSEEERKIVSPSSTKDIAGHTRVAGIYSPQDYSSSVRPVQIIKFSSVQLKNKNEETNTETTDTNTDYIAGWYEKTNGKRTIVLTDKANPTTFVHEMFHLFADVMEETYNSGEMSDYWMKQAETMVRIAGGTLEQDISDPAKQYINMSIKNEEKIANMFLVFLKDNKLENRELSPMFSYFSDLFKLVFSQINISYPYKLDNEAKDFFKSIIMAQEEIEQQQRLAGILEIEKPDGADQDLYDLYLSFMLQSRTKATQELIKKWKSIEVYMNSKDYKDKLKKKTTDNSILLGNSLQYQILEIYNTVGNKDIEQTKLIIAGRPETFEDPESITSAVIQDIVNTTPDLQREAHRLAVIEMEEEMKQHFNMTEEEFSLRTSRNTDKVKALVAESVLRKGGKVADFEKEYARVKTAADSQMGITIKKLKDKNYWNELEAKIVLSLSYHLEKKQMDKVAEDRFNQAVVNQIKIKANAIENRVARFKRFADSIKFAQKKNASGEYTYTAECYDLLQSILEQFGFKIAYRRRGTEKVVTKLENWITEQENTTYTSVASLRDFEDFILKGYKGNGLEVMSVNMFDKLEAVINTINAIGSKEYYLITEGEKTRLQQLANQTAQRMNDMGIKSFNDKPSLISLFGSWSNWQNPEPILRELFDEETYLKVWAPFIESTIQAERRGDAWQKQYRRLKMKVDLSNKLTTYSNGLTLEAYKVADLLLAMGNEHAYTNFLMKYQISKQQAEQVVSEALAKNPNLATFANGVWNLFNEVGDILEAEFRKNRNELFVKKDPRTFKINGIEFKGGYVPERIMSEDSKEVLSYGQGLQNKSGMGVAKNEKLVEKPATGKVHSIVDIIEDELFWSARQGTVAVEFNNVVKFMNKTNIKDIIGTQATSYLEDWLNDYNNPRKHNMDLLWRAINTGATISALGMRIAQGLIQLSGIIPAMTKIGIVPMLRAMGNNLKYLYNPIKAASSKSLYMEARFANPVTSLFGRNFADQINMESAETKTGKVVGFGTSAFQKIAMAPIIYCDAWVSLCTWEAAKNKALADGKTETEAIELANSEVRVTQTDSMQISRCKMLNNPWARTITPFSTYIMGMLSQSKALWVTGQKSEFVRWVVGYIVMSTFVESMFKEAWNGDDDDPKAFMDRVANRWITQIAETAGSSALPVAGLGGMMGKAVAAVGEKAITGENEAIQMYGQGATLSSLNYASQIPLAIYQLGGGIVTADVDELEKSLVTTSGLFSNNLKKYMKEWLNQ